MPAGTEKEDTWGISKDGCFIKLEGRQTFALRYLQITVREQSLAKHANVVQPADFAARSPPPVRAPCSSIQQMLQEHCDGFLLCEGELGCGQYARCQMKCQNPANCLNSVKMGEILGSPQAPVGIDQRVPFMNRQTEAQKEVTRKKERTHFLLLPLPSPTRSFGATEANGPQGGQPLPSLCAPWGPIPPSCPTAAGVCSLFV